MTCIRIFAAALLAGVSVFAQTPTDPFPTPINATDGVIKVNFVEFATAARPWRADARRPMLLVDEPGTRRLFVNDMRGPLYTSGATARPSRCISTSTPRLGRQRQFVGQRARLSELRVSSAVQPARERPASASSTPIPIPPTRRPCRLQAGRRQTHTRHGPARMDGEESGGGDVRRRRAARAHAVRASVRQSQRRPAGFNPLAARTRRIRSALHRYRGWRQRRRSARHRAESQLRVRQAPAHRSARERTARTANTAFRRQPVRQRQRPNTLGEIYAFGLRNPQRFTWDPKNGNLFVADIGQNIVEEISLVTAGANLGWNTGKAASAFVSRVGRQPR